jgi:hypothetical protein
MAKGEAKGQRQKTEATAKAQAKARHDGKFFRRKKQARPTEGKTKTPLARKQ